MAEMTEKAEKIEKATIICFSGDMDKAYAALIIASGAAAMGMQVSMFFTFWGLNLLKKGGLEKAPLSRMNMSGLGKKIMQRKLKAKNVASLTQLLKDAKELGVRLIACEMTMDIMGIKKENLIPEVDEIGGVGTYLNEAKDSKINLFI